MSLSISTETKGETTVVNVGGELDVYTAPRLKETLEQALPEVERLVLDLSEVHFLDSTALGVLVGAQQLSEDKESELRLVVDDPFVLKIFRIAGFEEMFSIYPKLEEALTLS